MTVFGAPSYDCTVGPNLGRDAQPADRRALLSRHSDSGFPRLCHPRHLGMQGRAAESVAVD